MMTLRTLFLTALGCSLSACASVDTASRNVPFETLPQNQATIAEGFEAIDGLAPELQPQSITPVVAAGSLDDGSAIGSVRGADLSISKVTVEVPRALKVSEANRYLPQGDIVWREDPMGDRHAQVLAIVQAALDAGVQPLTGPVEAELEVEVLRFHALTQKARYTTGGVHAIAFTMVLRDAQTGAALTEPREIEADLTAYGGQRALTAMAEGQTQKVRITEFLAQVIQQEILAPGTRQARRGGLIQALNKL
ncbi:DUF6778 family protein [Pseudophaeobacter sp.]|uniref:DUF6778 family protein n=1 Tax=Pseudophaeobacter sp. TaxID=1971739 RepID=UPI003297DD0B